MNILRRTLILCLGITALMGMQAAPAWSLTKSDRAALNQISAKSQAFLQSIQDNPTAILQAKGRWLAGAQANNKACQADLIESVSTPDGRPYEMTPAYVYLYGKDFAVWNAAEPQIRAYWRQMIALQRSRYFARVSSKLTKSYLAYMSDIATMTSISPFMLSGITIDNLCQATAQWKADGWDAKDRPEFFQIAEDNIEMSSMIWAVQDIGGVSANALGDMLRQVKAPVAVRKLVSNGYLGIPIFAYDPVYKAAYLS